MAIQRLPNDAHLVAVERIVAEAIKRECRAFNRRFPEVIVIATESDPRVAAQIEATSSTLKQSRKPNGKARNSTVRPLLVVKRGFSVCIPWCSPQILYSESLQQ